MAILANIAGVSHNQGSTMARLKAIAARSTRDRVGLTTQQAGTALQSIAPAFAFIPVVGQIATIGVELIGQFLKMFGSNYATSTNVRWLTQNYENYVLGQNQRSDNTVNENDAPAAQKWFSYVLGVPIFDRLDWYEIKGWDPVHEVSLNNTDAQKLAAYKTSPRSAGVSDSAIMQAIQIAKTMNFTDPHGSWASKTPAPSTIATTAVNDASTGAGSTAPGATSEAGMGNGLGLLFILGLAGAAIYMGTKKGKKRKTVKHGR